MHLITFVVVLVLALTLYPYTAEAQNCATICRETGGPVCGSLRRGRQELKCTFRNFCRLQKRRCATREEWSALLGRCTRDSLECRRIGGR
ncbi:vasotab-TY3-like [Musca domestica]|uniref:Vasotab-TY3-like n=1 Tax=Musca domestica TaxID=7370 RepID=A0ABM3V636_MUSDO|nr:vasotab-TY3-like [Musca domestica]